MILVVETPRASFELISSKRNGCEFTVSDSSSELEENEEFVRLDSVYY